MTLSISFEVFPPRSLPTALDATAGTGRRNWARLDAVVRVRHVRRRRIGSASGHSPPSTPFGRHGARGRRARHVRRAVAVGRRRRDRPLLGARGHADRRPARRPAERRRCAVRSRTPTATSAPPISSPASSSAAAFDVAVSAYPERHPQSPTDRPRPRRARREGRGGRRQGDHADVLRQRPLPPLPRPRAGPRHRHPDRAGHVSDPLVSRRRQVRRSMRRIDPRSDRRAIRRVSTTTLRRPTRSPPSWPNEQITELAAHGVDQVHIYTLNRADLAVAVCEQLGVASRSPRHERRRLTAGRGRTSASSCSTERAAQSSRRCEPSEDDLRGDRFRDHPIVARRQPRPARADPARVGASTCTCRTSLAGADIITTNTFSSTTRRAARVRPRRPGADRRAQLARPRDWRAGPPTRRSAAMAARVGSPARSGRPT